MPEVAFLDIGLPLMDGYELARRLRELAGSRALLLVAVTGYGQKAERELQRQPDVVAENLLEAVKAISNYE